MATITPNRQGLKDLADFNIDAQFCQQYGTQVFNYSGDVTPQFQQLCTNFGTVIDDIISDMQEVKKEIPVIGRE